MKQCPKCGKQYEGTNTLCPEDGTVLQKAGDDLIGQTLIGKYRIDEHIDEGGMGTVYRATHVLMEKIVAIKVLHPALAADDKIVARFTREAKAASRISHPHALTVTDFGESENGIVFLVMEYLRGRTLKDIIRREGPMELTRVIEIMRQVSGALEAAHGEGVVHRDLKSDNIMLEETASGGDWSKVLDFGIAKIQETTGQIDPALTAPNLIIGTPQYMSPEQCAQASEIDSRSDIYSLGVILYEMLTGHVPFTADSPTAIMMKHLQEPVPSVLAERKDLPAPVARVVERAMAKRPEDRFQKATEFYEALTLAATEGESAGALASATASGTGSATGQGTPDLTTNRIVVPTGENEPPRDTDSDDEATIVRAPAAGQLEHAPIFEATTTPPPVEALNPWRIVVPVIALMVIGFGVFYAISGGKSADQQAPPLTSDPNSQPVQSVAPPSGRGETNIAPVTSTQSPTPAAGAVGGVPVTTVPDITTQTSPTPQNKENQNTAAEATPTPQEEETPPEKPQRRAPTPPPPADANTDVKPSNAPTPKARPAPTLPPSTDAPPPAAPTGSNQ